MVLIAGSNLHKSDMIVYVPKLWVQPASPPYRSQYTMLNSEETSQAESPLAHGLQNENQWQRWLNWFILPWT